jgi:sulfur-oxidizing protein SoxX
MSDEGRPRVIISAWVSVGLLFGLMQTVQAQTPLADYRVSDDRIDAPLTSAPGDPARGKETALGRDAGNCQLCHQIPDSGLPVMGNVASSLAGVGARLTVAQLRLRIVDARRLNAGTLMPSYYRVEGLHDVASAWRGKPILTAQQIEDVVAYLATLKEPAR